MRAALSLYALTATETQLDLEGDYQPPLGPLGRVVDAGRGRDGWAGRHDLTPLSS
jgi:hypothetical protein